MSKKFSIFLSALFCAFIGGVCVISLLLPDKDFSPLENRYLTPWWATRPSRCISA